MPALGYVSRKNWYLTATGLKKAERLRKEAGDIAALSAEELKENKGICSRIMEALYKLGGKASSRQIADVLSISTAAVSQSLWTLANYGAGWVKKDDDIWFLSDKGREYVSGELGIAETTQAPSSPSGNSESSRATNISPDSHTAKIFICIASKKDGASTAEIKKAVPEKTPRWIDKKLYDTSKGYNGRKKHIYRHEDRWFLTEDGVSFVKSFIGNGEVAKTTETVEMTTETIEMDALE